MAAGGSDEDNVACDVKAPIRPSGPADKRGIRVTVEIQATEAAQSVKKKTLASIAAKHYNDAVLDLTNQ